MSENFAVMRRAGTGKGAARTVRREGQVPGVIYGDDKPPEAITVRFNELLKRLKAGRFTKSLLMLDIYDVDEAGERTGEPTQQRVICRAVQRDTVKDLPIHVDFLRLSRRSRINLFIPVEFVNHDQAPGIKRGGVLTIVRPEVELKVTAGDIPEKIIADLTGMQINDALTISQIPLPEGTRPMITDRDFAIANISAPSGLAAGGDDEEGEDAA